MPAIRPLAALAALALALGARASAHAQSPQLAPRPDPREWSSGGPLSPEQAAFDVRFYDLSVRVNPADSTILGAMELYATAVRDLDVLVLDLDTAYAVREVIDPRVPRGPRLAMERSGGRLRIRLTRRFPAGEMVAVRIVYAGRPRIAANPPWIGGIQWARTADGRPWIATTSVNEGADILWPVKDHPSDKPDSVAVHITVPRGLVAATAGRPRGSRDNPDGTTTWDWFVSTPISNYEVMLDIAPYRTITREYTSVTGERFPVTYWVLPENYPQGVALMDEIVRHLRFFERLLGPYPFRADKYGVAETPHLGMEHQTLIAYGNRYRRNVDGYDELHQHELAHEWWGNLITAREWSDYWLHEGFGSYMQPLYAEQLHGRKAYLANIRRQREGIRNLHPIAPREPLTAAEVYFEPPDYVRSTGDIYAKGSVVLHTLRWLVGDSLFFPTLRRFLYPTPESERVTNGRQVRMVSTDDFIATAERITGRELSWFFEVYVRRAELPKLEAIQDDDELRLRWSAPGGLPFPMPIEVEIDGARRRVEVPATGTSIRVPRGATVRVDPDGWVLRA